MNMLKQKIYIYKQVLYLNEEYNTFYSKDKHKVLLIFIS